VCHTPNFEKGAKSSMLMRGKKFEKCTNFGVFGVVKGWK
jgi:hypothetical protein